SAVNGWARIAAAMLIFASYHGDSGPAAPDWSRSPQLTFSASTLMFRPLSIELEFETRRPVLETGGNRPTARCALGRQGVLHRSSGGGRPLEVTTCSTTCRNGSPAFSTT